MDIASIFMESLNWEILMDILETFLNVLQKIEITS